MSDQGSKPPRVAIKFGGSSSSTKKHTRPANIRRHRAHAVEDEQESGSSGSEDGNSNRPHGRVEVITDLDWSTPSRDDTDRRRQNGRSEKDSRRRGDGRREDDRDSRRRDDNDRPSNGAEAGPEAQEKKPVKWGLTVNMKGRDPKDRKDEQPRTQPKSQESENGRTERSIDDQALDALLGNKPAPKRKHTSPDDEPDLEDYRTVPIDDFGATLLRNFGWNGEMRGKVKEATPRHANLAGLGAKNAKGAEELTSWNQKLAAVAGGGSSRGRDSRPPRLEDYQREERKKRQRVEERYGDSYKKERERERG